uniref:Protein translocase subunit SecA n=1 Tax=candidate division WOR-3 bacterium TaxID=2052148 RepID=A0A7C3UW84_UNCW3
MLTIVKKLFGTKNERELKRLWPLVAKINETWESLKNLRNEDFPKKTEDFIQRVKEGESLDEIMIEAYALVKEACRRLLGKKWLVCDIEITWDMVPFDCQLLGAIVLHEGKIAEMKTGEGKTLVATMPLYLNALTKRGVHLVTVNDYLARRDREWMGPIYEFLGLSVGCIQMGMTPEERKPQYNCDITYGTNNEFGFDYLRDNMVLRWEDKVQRGHYYAIIDEVDSILIDEARTPLIISGPVEATEKRFDTLTPAVRELYNRQTILVNRIVEEAKRLLKEGKEKEAGIKFLQAKRGSPKNTQLLKAEREAEIKKLIEKTELEFLRDKKFHLIDEELYYVTDEKDHTIRLTEIGEKFLCERFKDPNFFVIPDLDAELKRVDSDEKLSPREKVFYKEKVFENYAKKSERLEAIRALLKAFDHFKRDVDYIIQDGKVVIVDEFTGRLMPGRRFSDGIHQALEAKEGVRVQEETQTFATITLQNYFRMYEKLAGMTGTAATEAQEFYHIYKLDVVEIPTNKPVRRIDYPDIIYKTKTEKFKAIIDEIEKWHKVGRPILVGTTSVETSEILSRMLKRRGINHEVLNARHHQREAEIVAKAGRKYAVTIATNMAGRGTDIKLEPGVVKGEECYINSPNGGRCSYWEEEPGRCLKECPCGLYIIGTERHEARRIDNQLRGRSGRQGDPGSSRFFLSLEDDLMRLFGSDRMVEIMERFGQKEMEPLQHPLVSKAIANAQKRVEIRNFEIRKHLLEFDDVMNKQREVIYHLRDQYLKGENLKEAFMESAQFVIDELLGKYANDKDPALWNWNGLKGEFGLIFLADFSISESEITKMKREVLKEKLLQIAEERFNQRKEEIGEAFTDFFRYVFLRSIDTHWRDHLYSIDLLREGINWVAYGQKDPLLEYKQESFSLFQETLASFHRESLTIFFRAEIETREKGKPRPPLRAYKPVLTATPGERPIEEKVSVRTSPRVGRNDPCPCGSGKKYKKCCGKNL